MNDTELLREYLQDRSEPAFAELVRRYLDFVYSTARRQVGDVQMAEDVTQSVFCLLAKKAHGLAGQRTLGGWLYRATRFTAARAMRGEQRRKRREQEASQMNEDSHANADEIWLQLAPLLDKALDQLSEPDRVAVLLRFFQQKSIREVSVTLGVSEAAAKMRLSRSIERLRGFFAQRGVACSAAALALLLAEKSVTAAPAPLAGKVATKAFATSVGAVPIWQVIANLRGLLKTKPVLSAAVGLGLLSMVAFGLRAYTFARQPRINPTIELTSPVVITKTKYIPAIARPGRARKSDSGLAASPEDSADLDELIAQLRAALRDTNSSVIPGEDVLRTIKRFGPRAQAAYVVLKEEAATHDELKHPTDPSEWPSRRAVCGMGCLDKAIVPEAVPLLWNLYQASAKTTDSIGYDALVGLSALGFDAPDIASLCQRVLAVDFDVGSEGFVKSQAAKWVADIMKKDPANTQPFLGEVENLLDDSNAGIRFWAACALLEHEGESNPKVLAELEADLKNLNAEQLEWSSESIFKIIGAPGKPLVPALLAAAQATTEEPAHTWALRAAGNMDASLRNAQPEVEQLLASDEKNQAWLDKINSGKATLDDLVPALKEPKNAHVAAVVLGNMGANAAKAVPDMIQALQGQNDSGDFGEMVAAIRKIDPQAALAPNDRMPVMQSTVENLKEVSVEQALAVFDLFQKHSSWCTRQDVNDFARILQAQDPKAGHAFVAAVLEKNPAWSGVLQTQP